MRSRKRTAVGTHDHDGVTTTSAAASCLERFRDHRNVSRAPADAAPLAPARHGTILLLPDGSGDRPATGRAPARSAAWRSSRATVHRSDAARIPNSWT